MSEQKKESVLPEAVQKKVEEGRLAAAAQLGKFAAFAFGMHVDAALKEADNNKKEE